MTSGQERSFLPAPDLSQGETRAQKGRAFAQVTRSISSETQARTQARQADTRLREPPETSRAVWLCSRALLASTRHSSRFLTSPFEPALGNSSYHLTFLPHTGWRATFYTAPPVPCLASFPGILDPSEWLLALTTRACPTLVHPSLPPGHSRPDLGSFFL